MILTVKNNKLNLNLILNIAYVFISILIFILILLLRENDFISWSKGFVLLILFQMVFQIIFLKAKKVNLFSLSGMFLMLSYFFHFGQLFAFVIFPEYDSQRTNFYLYYNFNGMRRASEYSLITLLMVGFGILISTGKNAKFKVFENNQDLSICKKIGWILIFLTFPVQLYLDILKIIISTKEGYLATYSTGLPGVLSAFGFISFTGFTLLILGYSEHKKKSLFIYLAIVAYLILTMFSGHRGHQITIILFLSYIIHHKVVKIDVKKMVLLIFISFLGVSLLNTLFIYRGIEGKTFTTFINIFIEEFNIDSVKDILIEIGGTIRTVYLTMEQTKDYREFAYGTTYLASIFAVFPNIGNIFGDINTYAHYVKQLDGHALGGSYVGELYYNFSYFGMFLSVFIGIFVNKISERLQYYLKYKFYLNIAYLAPIFMYMLWWVRDAFISLLRPFIWGAIVLFVIKNLITKKI